MEDKKQKYCAPPAGAIAYTVNELCFLARHGRDKYYSAKKAGLIKSVVVANRDLIPVAAAREYLNHLGLGGDHVAA